MNQFKLTKKDALVSLIIGEAAGWLLLIVIKSLSQSASQLEVIPLWIWPVFFPFFCLFWLIFAFALAKKFKVFYQLGKFVLVGGLNFLVDLGVLNLLIFLSGIAAGWYFSLFKAVSFSVAVINSYLFNKFWTFKSPDAVSDKETVKGMGREFLGFLVITLVGLGINNLTASLIVNWIGPQWNISPELWANIGAMVASAVGLIWNFLGYKFFIFKK